MKLKRTLIGVAAIAVLTAGCTPSQIQAWVDWHNADPVAADAFLETPVFQELSDDGLQQAARGEQQQLEAPPAPPPSYSSASSNGRCVGYEGLLAQYSPGWDVARMSGIMYRESRCQPGASNSCCHGLLQMHEMHIGWLDAVGSQSDYYNPELNIRAAAQLWRSSGYGAWSTS